MVLPSPLRKIVGVFRGDVAPILICLSVTLGFWSGITPGWQGLHIVLVAAALLLNVHFGLFLLAAGLGKSICYAAAPALFHVGAWAQGSLAGPLGILSDLPIVGLTDFSRYAVTGATVIGPVVGLLAGLVLAGAVSRFRRMWLALETQSDALRQWRSKGWVRLLDRLLIGKSTRDIRAVLTRRPKIVRKAGVVLATGLAIVGMLGAHWLQGDRAAGYATDALTRMNGAEVNLAGFDLGIFWGRLSVTELQATNPAEPTRNRIRVGQLAAGVSLRHLLLGRVVLDNVQLSSVTFDQPRGNTGKVLPGRGAAGTAGTFDAAAFDLSDVDAKRLIEYLENTDQIERCLEWIQKWAPQADHSTTIQLAENPIPESYLAHLTARAPMPRQPRILVRRLELSDVTIPAQLFGKSRIICTNMSDAPAGARLPVTFTVTSDDHPVSVEFTFHHDDPSRGVSIRASFDDVNLATLQSDLSPRNPVTFQGGRASGLVEGYASHETIDLTMQVKTRSLQATAGGGGLFGLSPDVSRETMNVLENVNLTLRLVGPVTDPRLAFDGPALREEFKKALVQAGKGELARRVTDLVGDRIPGAPVDAKALLENPIESGRDLAEGLLRSGSDASEEPGAKDEKPREKLNRLLGPLQRGLKKSRKKD